MFSLKTEANDQIFDVPYYIVEAIKTLTGPSGAVVNGCRYFISAGNGIRARVNANEIAYYEFGAVLASHGVLELLDTIEPGKCELEAAAALKTYGQQITVQTICAAGDRFQAAVVESREKKYCLGETFSATLGLTGGLTNRTGYVARSESDLPQEQRDYIEKVVKPYYAAAASWYEALELGVRGGSIFDLIQTVVPKEIYGWSLNPGHLISAEEWLSSPFYPDSRDQLESGMMLQMDIIVSVPGYGGSNAEDGVVLADKMLREDLRVNYPRVWERICRRRRYMKDILGICLKEEVLPLSDSEGYLRPFVLNHDMALRIR